MTKFQDETLIETGATSPVQTYPLKRARWPKSDICPSQNTVFSDDVKAPGLD